MTLAKRLQKRIAHDGPVGIAEYMTLCLLDETHGYYPTRDPIGAGADFITAPEISQMFGELIGVWIADIWQKMGEPKNLHLIEPGPGKGTMMSDILRTMSAVPTLANAAQVHLIEASAALMAVQAKTLANHPQSVNWPQILADVPSGPTILIANEYLDCLPVQQFIRQKNIWVERLVDCDPDGKFQFVQNQMPISEQQAKRMPPQFDDIADNSLIEVRPGMAEWIQSLAKRAATHPTVVLLIDYGPANSEPGDTLQAVREHKKVDPLLDQGNVDLTARVDFEEIARLAKSAGLQAHGPIAQGEWLNRLGILERAAALFSVRPDQKEKIARQVHHLTDPEKMGALFKCMVLSSTGFPVPAGFE